VTLRSACRLIFYALTMGVDFSGLYQREEVLPAGRSQIMTDSQKKQIIKLRLTGMGYGKISSTVGVSINTVKSFCRRNPVNENISPEKVKVLSGESSSCENCGQTINQIAQQKKRRFCCDACRNKWWNSHLDLVERRKVYTFICPHCKKEFQIYGDSRRKYCSHACYIADRFGGGSHE